MSKPKKARETESERMQRRQARIFFEKGSQIKATSGKQFVADITRDGRGREAAKVSANSAIAGQQALKKKRQQSSTQIADAVSSQAQINLTQENAAGITQTERLARGASRATNSASQSLTSVRMASSLEHQKAINKMKREVEKSESALNIASTIGGEYLNNRSAKQNKAKQAQKKTEHDAVIQSILGG